MEVKYTKLQVEGATGLHSVKHDLTPALRRSKRTTLLTSW